MPLQLSRPIAVIDLETTGLDVNASKIIALGMARIEMDGRLGASEALFFHPGIPIPPETTAVHGITDADVRDCPRFEAMAADVRR